MSPEHSAQARSRIASILREHDDFVVMAHVNPDGDAIGSTAAMGHILAALGKTFTLFNVSPMPRSFDWLEMPAQLTERFPAKMDWVISLDSGDIARLGRDVADVLDTSRLVNIDHHLGNPKFGAVNWVDPSMSSTGEMVAGLARELDIPLTGPLGKAIYLSLVTDTGWFSYDNTSPATLELAAEIVRGGLQPGPFNAQIQNQWTLARIKLFSEALGNLELHEDGRIAVIRIDRDMLARTGTDQGGTDGLIEFARRIRGVQVAISVREDQPGEMKFSLRSTGDVDIQQVAAALGGGGHKNAAGGLFRGTINHAVDALLSEVHLALKNS